MMIKQTPSVKEIPYFGGNTPRCDCVEAFFSAGFAFLTQLP
jgi:hypothetical protein